MSHLRLKISGPSRNQRSSIWEKNRFFPRAAHPQVKRCRRHLPAYMALFRAGFTSRQRLRRRWWSLTPPFHLYHSENPRVSLWKSGFCGTFRRISPPSLSEAPCLVELGLSSPIGRDRFAYFSQFHSQIICKEPQLIALSFICSQRA